MIRDYRGHIDREAATPVREERRWATTSDNHWLSILRRYPPDGPVHRTPVVLVHGFAQNSHTWDLPQRSYQNFLVAQGFDTYNLELRGHGLSRGAGAPYASRFEEYYEQDLPAALLEVERASGCPQAFLVGHSLGCSIAYAFGVRHPSKVAGIVSIGGPTHIGRGSTANRRIGSTVCKLFRDNPTGRKLATKVPFAFGDHAAYFVMWNKWLFDNPRFEFPLAVWLARSMEPEVTWHRTVDGWDRTGVPIFVMLMRWFGSPEGHLSDDDSVNYSQELVNFTSPVFFVVGNRDAVAPLSSIQPGFDLCGSDDKSVRVFGGTEGRDYGHIDLIMGRHASIDIWPSTSTWMAERSEKVASSDERAGTAA